MDAYHSSHLVDAFQSSSKTPNADDLHDVPWEDCLNDFVDWSQEVHDTAGYDVAYNDTGNGMFEQWLSTPGVWYQGLGIEVQQRVAPDASHTIHENDAAHLQRQVNELRATLSTILEQGHAATASTSSKAVPATSTGTPYRPHTRTLSSSVRGSFSMSASGTGTPSFRSGFSTPAEPLESPFDYPDDSPIYSRRSSVQSNISAPGKRGQRIPGGYRCTQCSAAFDLPSTLRHHERKHISKEQRRHGCAECGSRFLFPKDLARHERNVHKHGTIVPVSTHDQHTESQTVSNLIEHLHGICSVAQRWDANSEQSRKRHWDKCAAAVRARSRDRRLTDSSDTSTAVETEMPEVTWPEDVAPGLRRDSIIPDIIMEDVGKPAVDVSGPVRDVATGNPLQSERPESDDHRRNCIISAENMASTNPRRQQSPIATQVRPRERRVNSMQELVPPNQIADRTCSAPGSRRNSLSPHEAYRPALPRPTMTHPPRPWLATAISPRIANAERPATDTATITVDPKCDLTPAELQRRLERQHAEIAELTRERDAYAQHFQRAVSSCTKMAGKCPTLEATSATNESVRAAKGWLAAIYILLEDTAPTSEGTGVSVAKAVERINRALDQLHVGVNGDGG